MSARFPKRMRLRKRREFLAAQNHRERRKYHGNHFLVIVAPGLGGGEIEAGRVGITVSKKVGNAVVRNRIKRLVREFVRSTPDWLPDGRDVVVIAKHSAARISGLADVVADLGRLDKRMHAC